MTQSLPIAGQEAEAAALRIGDVARLSQKSARAVRLYEEMGLLGDVIRTDGGHRLYCETVLRRIAWIDKFQGLGFSLSQIQKLLGEWESHDIGPNAMARVEEIFSAKLEEIRGQIEMLRGLESELKDGLRYLEACTQDCEADTILKACEECEQPHATDDTPELVAGFYACGSES